MNNQAKTILLLGGLSLLVVGLGALAAPGYWWIFAAVAVGINFFSYFFSDKMVLRMNRARQVSESEQPELHAIVAELAAKAQIPKPKVFIVNDPAPNAFATGRNPAHGVVAVTTGIMELLSQRELRGVIAHELAHIKNRDILIASVAAMAATIISLLAQFFLFFGGRDSEGRRSGPGVIILALLAPVAAGLIKYAISRSREYIADETGAKICEDPEALASALAKLSRNPRLVRALETNPSSASLYISNPLSGESVRSWFSTHPPMSSRIERLMDMAQARR